MTNEENKLHPRYFPPKKGEKVMFSDWPLWKIFFPPQGSVSLHEDEDKNNDHE